MNDHQLDTPLPHSRWNGRIPIAATLAIAIGFLMLVAVSSVLGVGFWLAKKNTFELISQNIHQTLSTAAGNIKTHLKPAEYQAKFIADWIGRGQVDIHDTEKLGTILKAALAAAPQIDAIIFIDPQLQSFSAGRDKGRVTINRNDYSKDPVISRAIADASRKPQWGPPVWRERYHKTYLYRAHPVLLKGKFIGAIVAVVSIQELSRFVDDSTSISQGTRFLLYGRDHVLAHWMLEDGFAGRTAATPLPSLSKFSDPILSSIWYESGRSKLELPLLKGTNGHSLQIHNNQYVFLYQKLEGFGPEPFIVGAYLKETGANAEIRRMKLSLIAGLLVLVASVGIAIYVGRRIARPIVKFSDGITQIRDLEISRIDNQPPSVFKELNEQSNSFNAMLQALRWFEMYVPGKIVEGLIKRGTRIGDNISDLQNITVMFTDIVGFSSACEGKSAQEVASFVNHHFTLITKCIEDEGGTIDKFIGDSVMAFWGAPEVQPDAAQRACRAALAIRAALQEDNILLEENGNPSIHIRIGIHSGPAVVGNIGAPDRINYTAIGDTVNIAQRLEQVSKELKLPSSPAVIVLSDATFEGLGDGFEVVELGLVRLRGLALAIKAHKLL